MLLLRMGTFIPIDGTIGNELKLWQEDTSEDRTSTELAEGVLVGVCCVERWAPVGAWEVVPWDLACFPLGVGARARLAWAALAPGQGGLPQSRPPCVVAFSVGLSP